MQNEIARFSYYFYRIIVELKFEGREREISCIIFAVSFFFFSRKFFCNNFAAILLTILIFVRYFVIQSKLCIRVTYIFYRI